MSKPVAVGLKGPGGGGPPLGVCEVQRFGLRGVGPELSVQHGLRKDQALVRLKV